MTEKQLEICHTKDLKDVSIHDLVDISTISVDKSKPKFEKINDFINQIGNPYFFKAGNICVRVSFKSSGPTLQEKLVYFLNNN